MRMSRSVLGLLVLTSISLSGCGAGLDTTYGRMRSPSVNGTGAFASLLREGGHETRTFSRLGTRIEDWADTIVRFAPIPGPPESAEASWYDRWLNGAPGRMVIYIPRDFDATHEYWSRALSELPADASPRLRERVTEARDESENWATKLPPKAKSATSGQPWFALESKFSSVATCKTLEGPWAENLDPAKVALPRHAVFKLDNERVLLSCEGKPLVMDWELHSQSRVLAVASGAFLLNEPMTRKTRTPLALKVVEWLSTGGNSVENPPNSGQTIPRRIAFVEGRFVTTDKPAKRERDYRLEIQLGLLGLAASLSVAPRLGRPRREPSSGADRPVAHPEALGALLARTRKASEARSLLETYRRWRLGPGSAGRGGPTSGAP